MTKAKILLAISMLAVLAGGCATPIYSGQERANQIGRNIDLEFKMMQDDIDRALLLRPNSKLSRWVAAQ